MGSDLSKFTTAPDSMCQTERDAQSGTARESTQRIHHVCVWVDVSVCVSALHRRCAQCSVTACAVPD